MNRSEAAKILEIISTRQTLDEFDVNAIESLIAPMRFEDVYLACIEIRKTTDWITAARLSEQLSQSGSAWEDYRAICDRIIKPGIASDCANRREPVPAELFPSKAAHAAWRRVNAEIRNGSEEAGWKAFKRAYVPDAAPERPQIDGNGPPSLSEPVSNVLEHPTRQNASTGLQSADLPIVGRRA